MRVFVSTQKEGRMFSSLISRLHLFEAGYSQSYWEKWRQLSRQRRGHLLELSAFKFRGEEISCVAPRKRRESFINSGGMGLGLGIQMEDEWTIGQSAFFFEIILELCNLWWVICSFLSVSKLSSFWFDFNIYGCKSCHFSTFRPLIVTLRVTWIRWTKEGRDKIDVEIETTGRHMVYS